MSKTIGIIGGMGPQASILLHKKIVDRAIEYGAVDGNDFPKIIHFSLPINDSINNNNLLEKDIKMLQKAAKAMSNFDADSVIIACNTMHLFQDTINHNNSLPIVSLPRSALASAKQKGARVIGLLGSPNTINSGLYQSSSEQEMELLGLGRQQLVSLEEVIRRVIAGRQTTRDKDQINKMIADLRLHGAEVIILGCTELSVLYEGDLDPDMIDPLEEITKKIFEGEEDVRN